jgi:hypothetical protein
LGNRNGREALFWEDVWQQRPKWDAQEQLTGIKDAMSSQGKTRVAHYWTQEGENHKWRKWIPKEDWLGIPDQEMKEDFLKNLTERKIPVSNEPDKLCWGWSTKGSFSVKEAYSLAAEYQNLPKQKIWQHIWQQKLRPKVTIFLWLLTQNKTLTWDNLCKRGFIDPSRCILCQTHEETNEHIFNSFPFVETLWQQSETLFRRI